MSLAGLTAGAVAWVILFYAGLTLYDYVRFGELRPIPPPDPVGLVAIIGFVVASARLPGDELNPD